MRSRFQRGAWRRPNGRPGVWPWGYMTPENNFQAAAYYPAARDREALGTGRVPYWHVVNFTLAALASGDDEFLTTGKFVGLALMGRANQGPGTYQAQFFQVENAKGSHGRALSRVPTIDRNAIGTGALPWIFRALYPMPDLLSLMVKVQNRSTAANTIQLALYGVQRNQGAAR